MQQNTQERPRSGPPRLVASSTARGNIAVILTEGFCVLELALVVEVLQKANQTLAARRRGTNRFTVTLLSLQGGAINSSTWVRVSTDAVDQRFSERFEGVFMMGDTDAHAISEDPMVVNVLKLVSKSEIVRANGKSANAATQYPKPLSSAVSETAPKSDMGPDSGSLDETPIAAVLAMIRTALLHPNGHQASRRTVEKESQPDARRDKTASPESTDPIHIAMRWLRENSHQKISIAQVAEVAKMSERNFLRRFKLETGTMPSEYLLDARFETSCTLLIKTNLPIDKIARRSGMGNGERLCRVFKRRLSQTPSEYRLAQRSTLDHV